MCKPSGLHDSARGHRDLDQSVLTDSVQIVFVFILILFIDSVNRVYRVQVELAAAGKEGKGGAYVYHHSLDV